MRASIPPSLGQLDELLIGSGVLHDQFGLAVDGEHDGVAGFLQLAEESGVLRLKFESESMSLFISSMAVGSLHLICIKFDAITFGPTGQRRFGIHE